MGDDLDQAGGVVSEVFERYVCAGENLRCEGFVLQDFKDRVEYVAFIYLVEISENIFLVNFC